MRKTKPLKYKGQTITRLPSGRFRISIKDGTGKTYRPSFPTANEAKAALRQFLEGQARGERFLATAVHTTFGEACELRIRQLIHDGRAYDTIEGVRGMHRRDFADFASQSLSWFVDDRMQAVKQWLTDRKNKGYSAANLIQLRKEMKLAFDAAIEEGKMAPPNPMTAYGVSVPHVETTPREPLSIDDITALVGGAVKRGSKREPELVCHARYVMTILGLSVPLRDQDLCGLCWDFVDLDGRLVYLHRKVVRIEAPRGLPRGQPTKQYALVEGTKTGDSGKGECHLNPVAHAVLTWWRELLRERGFPTAGRVPVMRTSEAAALNTRTVQASHMPALMRKAKLVNAADEPKYTWYNLRHTVPSMWRAVGMDLDHIKDRMRHMQINTTMRYRHVVPEYAKVLRPLVEDMIDKYDLQRTPDGIIEALGLVLWQMWRSAGIDTIPCSPPTTMRQRRLPGYRTADADPAALNGIVIDVMPDTVTMAERPTRMQQLLMSPGELAELRRAEARRLRAPPDNWSKTRIAKHLGLSDSVVSKYLAFEPDQPLNMRKLQLAKMKELHGQIAVMLADGRNTQQIADALNLKKGAVATFARQRGTPVKYYRAADKLAQHEEQIRRWNAEGKTNYWIGKALGFGSTTIDACIKRLGLRAAGEHHRRPRTQLAQSGTSGAGEG